MKIQLSLSIVVFIVASLTALPSLAKETDKEKLSTNVEFDPMTVHGRYQYAAEGTAKVEDEKVLYDLLGPRKNFKDRINQMAKQNR